jgi:hypothetical protein
LREAVVKLSLDARLCKSIGRLCGARSCEREEARFVGCRQSGDCKGGEEAVGEGEEAGEESSGIVVEFG